MQMLWAVRIGALLLASTLAVQVAACSSDSEAPAPAPTTLPAPSATPSSTATVVAARDAVAAWRGMWQDMMAAARTSDAASPLLGRHAMGAALEQLVSSLAADRQAGVVTRGEYVLAPRVTKVVLAQRPPMVLISDCGDATEWLKYRAGTNRLQDNVPGGRHAMGGTVLQVNGDWKVAGFNAQGVGTC